MNKIENHQWDENKVNHYDKRKIHHLDEKVFNWMKKFISLVEIKSSIGWNKIYLLDINIFNQLDEIKIHQLMRLKFINLLNLKILILMKETFIIWRLL